MYKNLYRRMRVLLHRYPLLPFLLAATLAVDVLVLFFNPNNPVSVYQRLLVGSLVSQFSITGIWVVHRFRGFGLRLGIAVIFMATYSLLVPNYHQNSKSEIAIIAAMISITSMVTCFLSNIFKLAAYRRRQFRIPSFNIKELLILSTTTAMLIYALKKIKFAQFTPDFPVALSVIAFLITLMWCSCSIKYFSIRLAAPCLTYALLGWALLMPDYTTISGIVSTNILEAIYYSLFEQAILKLGIVAFTLIWAYGLQSRRQPIRQRKKKQQAIPNESEQPVVLKVVNQDEEPTEPPGPIDLTV